ncbi:MAG: pilus (MSHA type) biogenesis protein MshL [Dissulfurimicrobium sp.]|uniref:pilus (MSHA type) biogenesis protein MshL n=2 Tax=Dissulfurimicrobium TaxID=1769732 RepID=UPI003C764EB1
MKRKTVSFYCPLIVLIAAFMLIGGCALGPGLEKGQPVAHIVPATQDLSAQPSVANDVANDKDGPIDQAPRFKSLSPLDTQIVTLSFNSEDYKNILQALAMAAGLNLVIDPAVDAILKDNRTLTAEYQERPVRDVLDSVCRALDISWHESEGTIYVTATVQKVFNLDFLASVRQSKFTVGGDVLGGGYGSIGASGSSSGSAGGANNVVTPLTGSFELTGQTADKVTDIYKSLEDSLKERIGDGGSFFLNRQTGTLLVKARPRIVDEIGVYLRALRSKYRRQVLIEANLLEVQLTSGHELGVDWSNLEATLSRSPLQTTGAKFIVNSTTTANGLLYGLHLSQRYYDVSTVLHALEQYGNVKTLSNPRLKVMNGQSAVISVGQSVSYLKSLQQNLTSGGTGGGITTSTTTAEISSIFDGVLLGVTPVIEGDGFVTLHIVPIKSDLISLEEREFTGGNRYTFPKVDLREASTVLRVMSGEMVILGGLIQERKEDKGSGVPLLDRLPYVGKAFKYNIESNKRVELVILMQVKII